MTREERRGAQVALVAAYEQSGQSQRAFALERGIPIQTFYSWVGRARRNRLVQGSRAPRVSEGKFIEVTAATPTERGYAGSACRVAIGPLMLWLNETPTSEWLAEVIGRCRGT